MVVQVAMEMTLDEWKAMQEMNRPKAEFNIRKAVDKIPSKAKVIHQSKNPEARKRFGHLMRTAVHRSSAQCGYSRDDLLRLHLSIKMETYFQSEIKIMFVWS